MTDYNQSLISPEALKQLTRRSDLKGLAQLAIHLLLIATTAFAVTLSMHSIWLVPALLAHGIVLVFVFAPLHETIHYTAFRRRWLNNSVAALFGFILFLPFQYFRHYHYLHHRHTQNPDKDPELIDKRPLGGAGLLWQISGIPIWQWHLTMLWQHAAGHVPESYMEKRLHATIIVEARIHVALYLLLFIVSLITANTFLLFHWIIPIVLGQPFLRLYLLAEHSGCDLGDNMLENSRTTYTSPLINLLAWNMPYHAEHHYRASVPFHALPALHAYTGQSLKYRADGYRQVIVDIFNQAKQAD